MQKWSLLKLVVEGFSSLSKVSKRFRGIKDCKISILKPNDHHTVQACHLFSITCSWHLFSTNRTANRSKMCAWLSHQCDALQCGGFGVVERNLAAQTGHHRLEPNQFKYCWGSPYLSTARRDRSLCACRRLLVASNKVGRMARRPSSVNSNLQFRFRDFRSPLNLVILIKHRFDLSFTAEPRSAKAVERGKAISFWLGIN